LATDIIKNIRKHTLERTRGGKTLILEAMMLDTWGRVLSSITVLSSSSD